MNPIRFPFLVATAVGAMLLLAGCGQDDEVAAVGTQELTEDDLLAILAAGEEEPATAPATAVADAVGEWIFWEQLIAEVADRGFALTDADLEAGREMLGEIPPPEGLPEPGTRYDEILVRYRAVPGLVARWMEEGEGIVPPVPAVMCSSHILLETEEEADDAIARFEAGEDFAALAMELSTGPTGPDGGDLGCVDPATFVPEFVEGARAVDPPGISVPTQSSFGWHVIYVDAFDETDFVSDRARDEAVLNAAPDLVRDLQDAAVAREVDLVDKYGTWDPATARVVPPGDAG